MTDAEIRKQLADYVESEQLGVFVDSPKQGPPLLLISHDRLTPGAVNRLRECVSRHDAANQPILLLEKMDVYQLVNGVWCKL